MRIVSAVLSFSLSYFLCACSAVDSGSGSRWYRGNLHTHSLWSDGNDFPEVIAKWYRDQGYDFLALSDHNVLSRTERWIEADLVVRRGGRLGMKRYREQFGADWVETRKGSKGKLEVRLKRLEEFRPLVESPGEFLLIEAQEITDRFGKLPIHMNATNLVELIEPRHGESVREVIANNLASVEDQSKRTGQPILAHVNHPNFGYGITAEDLAAVVEEHFFEIYNGHPGVNQDGDHHHADMETLWDVANTIRIGELNAPPLYGLATDDSHDYFRPVGSISGRGWVMVRAASLDADALITAIEAGDFYGSSGVALNAITFADGVLSIEIDAVAGETYTTHFIGTRKGYDRTTEPVVDEEGKPVRATRRYSKDIGTRLASVVGTSPSYTLTGDELYVRAVVVSSAQAERQELSWKRHKQAWVQPVGW